MEEDILNYLQTVMFRGTPCMRSLIWDASTWEMVHLKKKFQLGKLWIWEVAAGKYISQR